jgi:N-acetylglutamate synthase/N-acetylornithine aminotransferase
MALAGEDIGDLGPGRIDADELGTDATEAEIAIRLGRGDGRSRVYFSDLTPEYIRINAEYRT